MKLMYMISFQAQASVNVILEDNNDNPPIFTQPVYLGSVWEDNLYQLPGQVVEMVWSLT